MIKGQLRGNDGRWLSLVSGVEDALLRAGRNEIVHVALGPVRRPAALSRRVGIDVRGFKHAVSNHALQHTFNHHGDIQVERSRGQIAVTTQDIARLVTIVSKGRYEAAKPRSFGPPRFAIIFLTGNVEFHYIAEVRRKKRRIDMITMWKKVATLPTAEAKAGTSETTRD